jgi:hypothetical protein
MGDCIFCGKPAGFLRRKHKECEEQEQQRQRMRAEEIEQKQRMREAGRAQIIAEALRTISGTKNFVELESTINGIATAALIPETDKTDALVHAWESAVERSLDDSLLDRSEEQCLVDFSKRFALAQIDLDKRGAFTKVRKAALLRDILHGVLPPPAPMPGDLAINLQKNEQLVWSFADVEYLEDRTRRQYVGGSQGVSVRIMKGVYYRGGAFKGHPVEYTERTRVDSGWVLVTNKHIYFSGVAKSLRIPYTKIITFIPFENGFGIMRDAATAKPQIFVVEDGWFAYNLVTNLARL